MKRQLTIAIESGEKTCASEPRKFCPWVQTVRFGTMWQCGLFGGKELDRGEDGEWLQRLPECIASENR